MFKMYYYGCKSHNTDFGAVPVKGILMWRPSKDDKYYRTLVYSRRLSHAEMEKYQLDFIGCDSDSTVTLDMSDPEKLVTDESHTLWEGVDVQDAPLASQDALQGPGTLQG